jgi:hypothetical protein
MLLILFMLYTAGCASTTGTPDVEATVPADQMDIQILFDDFDYSSIEEMSANGWIVRSGMGWPGVTGASFRSENVSFVEYPAQPGNRLLRMTSATDGSREGTFQTQICHQRKYLAGTYAARVRFSDEPVSGVDGDQIVQTFYMITPYDRPLNPDFSEMDFEYLPNGGWGRRSDYPARHQRVCLTYTVSVFNRSWIALAELGYLWRNHRHTIPW